MSLTLKEWDAIATRLEPQVMSTYGEKEQQYIWALYGGLPTNMKDLNISIDEVLVLCEEKVTGKKKGLRENNERKSVQ